MLAQRADFDIQHRGDVHERVGALRADQPDLPHVMRLEALGEELGEDEPRLRRREDRVERHVGGRAVVGMVHVARAVVADRRIARDDGVGPVPAHQPREITPHVERRRQDAVFVAEEHDLRDAEHATGRALLLLADLGQSLARHVGRRRFVRAGLAAGQAHGDDLAARARPLGERSGHRELLIVGVRVNREYAFRFGRFFARHGGSLPLHVAAIHPFAHDTVAPA